MVKQFLGSGCSRSVWSLGNKTCVKIPIEDRKEAGILQNKLEYENFKLGEAEDLHCFPKAISHNEDFSEIIVEECRHIKNDSELIDSFSFPEEIKKHIEAAMKASNSPTFAQFIGFWIFGWLEGMSIEHVVNSSCSKLSRDALEKVLPFKNLNDIYDFLGMLIKSDTSITTHARLVYILLNHSNFLLDVLKFKLNHPSNLFIRDLWNIKQFGISDDGHLVVIDAGYNIEIANSKHFAKNGALKKEVKCSEDLDTFNGEECNKITSPTGSPIEWKFFTSRGTEYVLSSEKQARRIKQAGLNDDGLHPWMDRMVFVDEKDAIDAMNTMARIQQTLTPVKLDTDWMCGSKLNIQKLVLGQWQTQLSVVIQDTNPQLGKNVLEFTLDGSIVKQFHAGHDVTKLKHFVI